MAIYYVLVVAINLLIGALLYYFSKNIGLKRKTALFITCFSLVISIAFPLLLSIMKLYQELLLILLLMCIIALFLQDKEDKEDNKNIIEQEITDFKTAEDYLKGVNTELTATEDGSIKTVHDDVIPDNDTYREYTKLIDDTVVVNEDDDLTTTIEEEEEIEVEVEELEVEVIEEEEIELEELEAEVNEEEEEIEVEELETEVIEEEEEIEAEESETEESEAEVNEEEEEIEEELEESEAEAITVNEIDINFINQYIDNAFLERAAGKYEEALNSLGEALTLTYDPSLNLMIAMELSSVYKEIGQYELASGIIGAYMNQHSESIDSELQLELLLNLRHIDILRDLLSTNGTPDIPYKVIPSPIIKQAELLLEEWKWKLLT